MDLDFFHYVKWKIDLFMFGLRSTAPSCVGSANLARELVRWGFSLNDLGPKTLDHIRPNGKSNSRPMEPKH